MRNLSNIGRIFYGAAIAEIGCQTIYYKDFPYFLLPPNHLAIPGFVALAFISGALFIMAGACIVFKKATRLVSLLLGSVLLLIFCFYFVPYEFMTNSNYKHLEEWENALKELALAGGAFIIGGCFPKRNENSFTRFFGEANTLGGYSFFHTDHQFRYSPFYGCERGSIPDSIVDTLPPVLDVFLRCSVTWFGHCNYFKDQSQRNRCSFRNNDFYLVYFSPHPQGNCGSK